jgi:hypothetical protein
MRHTFESDSVAEDLEELVKERRVVIVIENLFFCVLALLHVYDTHFQFRLDENLGEKREGKKRHYYFCTR